MKTTSLSNRYLLAPDTKNNNPYLGHKVFHEQEKSTLKRFLKSLGNVSEWMAVPKPMFDLTGKSCNKIGVGYTAFRTQPQMCVSKWGR